MLSPNITVTVGSWVLVTTTRYPSTREFYLFYLFFQQLRLIFLYHGNLMESAVVMSNLYNRSRKNVCIFGVSNCILRHNHLYFSTSLNKEDQRHVIRNTHPIFFRQDISLVKASTLTLGAIYANKSKKCEYG